MRADLITVPSRATEREILARVPQLAADRIRLVVPGIGDEFRVYDSHIVRREAERLGLPQSYILSVGTIEPRKNLARLVEAYIRLVRQGGSEAHLVLVGRLGWNYEDVLSRLKVPELGAKIHLTGYVSGSDLPWYYAAARLFVYPSLQEGFGFPPLEAMACGVPVVSSLSTSLVENLRGAAELVEPDNVESLTSAIRKLLCDEGLRDERKKLGLERASRFRWAETARQTLECYSDLSGAI